MHAEVVLLEKRCPLCKQVFYDCIACHRGQVYCSPACRIQARQASLRRARARHQRSEEGRQDHRDRNRALRARQRGVMDHSAKKSTSTAIVSAAPGAPERRSVGPSPGPKGRIDERHDSDSFSRARTDADSGNRLRQRDLESGVAEQQLGIRGVSG